MTTPSDVALPHLPANGPIRAIFLVGFMGAGKTSVGQALADSLGWRFVDLDARIVARTGRTVAEIFEHDGEARFRRMETNELRGLLGELGSEKAVVSLGGGAWMQAENAELLRDASLPVLHLHAPVEELWQRCLPQQGTRPLLQSESAFRELYAARSKAYTAGTLMVETQGHSIEEVASQVRLLLGLAGTNATT